MTEQAAVVDTPAVTDAPAVVAEPVITAVAANTDTTKDVEVKTETIEAKQPEGAPEKYEFGEIENADVEMLDSFSGIAKELNLTNDIAKGIVSKMVPAIVARQEAQRIAMIADWQEKSSSDKEFGGNKETLDKNLAVAKGALETFGTPELISFLNETGLGNNPEIIRAFYRAGKQISQDSKVVTGGSGTSFSTTAQTMFPNMNP